MYCNIVFMIDIFVISKITQYRYYVIAITDVRSLGLSTKWRTLMIKKTMKVPRFEAQETMKKSL